MSLVMVNAHKLADLEGLVLPLYDELKIPKTPITYELVISMNEFFSILRNNA